MKKTVSLIAIGWPYFALFSIFFWPLLILKESFIFGDYSVQHLPWAQVAYQAVRQGRLPLWTNEMSCGFPLFAEGQCASLYFLNWISWKVLPFIAAYTWSIPLHFLIGGAGMFFYARRLQLSREAAVLAAICFCFASGYAGCFYNTGSLRTLCWLPVILYLCESIRTSRKNKETAICFVSLCFLASQQWIAGFPQIAVYSFAYWMVHEFLVFVETKKAHAVFFPIASLVLGTMIAWPQIAPTLELIHESIRQGESVNFALWGSVPPLAPVSLFFPQWGTALHFSFYVGILPLFFVTACLFSKREKAVVRHGWLALIFFLLALGKFNPLYRWTIETFQFTSMRNPAKFLFFSGTSLSLLAAFGYDALVAAVIRNENLKKIKCFIAAFLGVVILIPLAAQMTLKALTPFWPAFTRSYVSRLIIEKGTIAKPTSYYTESMGTFFRLLPKLFSYSNSSNLESLGLFFAGFVVLTIFLNKKIRSPVFYGLVSLLIVWDLLFFGFTYGIGFIGNARPLSFLKPTANMEKIIDQISRKPGSLVECVHDPKQELFPPNRGMAYDVPHAGGYSPLLLKRYYDWTYDLGIMNGSLGRAPFREDIWEAKRERLDAIGARYIHSDFPLALAGTTLIESSKNFYLYENERSWPDLVSFDGRQSPLTFQRLENTHPEELHFRVQMDHDGTALARITAYPGWHLKIDGQAQPWQRTNEVFIGFELTRGEHEIQLSYKPSSWPIAWFVAAVGLAFSLLFCIFIWRRPAIIS